MVSYLKCEAKGWGRWGSYDGFAWSEDEGGEKTETRTHASLRAERRDRGAIREDRPAKRETARHGPVVVACSAVRTVALIPQLTAAVLAPVLFHPRRVDQLFPLVYLSSPYPHARQTTKFRWWPGHSIR